MKQYTFKDGTKVIASSVEEAKAKHKVMAAKSPKAFFNSIPKMREKLVNLGFNGKILGNPSCLAMPNHKIAADTSVISGVFRLYTSNKELQFEDFKEMYAFLKKNIKLLTKYDEDNDSSVLSRFGFTKISKGSDFNNLLGKVNDGTYLTSKQKKEKKKAEELVEKLRVQQVYLSLTDDAEKVLKILGTDKFKLEKDYQNDMWATAKIVSKDKTIGDICFIIASDKDKKGNRYCYFYSSPINDEEDESDYEDDKYRVALDWSNNDTKSKIKGMFAKVMKEKSAYINNKIKELEKAKMLLSNR